MNNEKFVGFFIMGTNTQEDAEQGKGLMLWMQSKPSALRRWLNKNLLSIRWVDKEAYDLTRLKNETLQNTYNKVEMPKQRSYKKKDNGPIQERRNTKPGSTSNREQA